MMKAMEIKKKKEEMKGGEDAKKGVWRLQF